MTDEPREIDCLEALDRLYDYIDGELTPARAEEVRRHLEQCKPCLKVSEFETAWVQFLEARTRVRQAPAGLRKRVLESLLFEDDATRQS
ncbi:MAG: mycothiol system anti-sigma-R factor [Gemmatimonadota bacterium]|nr:MAG: mycothiol system anti-sigma-R factor [Gemmatimonadota bacterium]